VLVWEKAEPLPPADLTARWEVSANGALLLHLDGTIVTGKAQTVDVPLGPSSLAHPEYLLGQASTNPGYRAQIHYVQRNVMGTLSVAGFPSMTARQAIDSWEGHRLTITTNNSMQPTSIVVGPEF
jgi:hypothetical protein